MKILYVTTVGITMGFFKSFVKGLLDSGHTVDIATNEAEYPVAPCYAEWGCKIYPISTSRSPLSFGNLRAVKQIKKLVADGAYDIVHCHTPIAAICTRLACRKARKKQGTRVFYTAHGFHFYQGAPKKNWMIYYTAEKLCARHTDMLVTINREDHALASQKLKAKEIAYVPGVGINLERFGHCNVDKAAKRAELGVPEGATLLLSVGELNENKNHETAIRAIADLSNVYYMIAGTGHLTEHLQGVIDTLGLADRVKLLGYRTDIGELCAVADLFVFPSFREGLSVSVMEAMASGLPVVCSRIRGNTDLVDDRGGALFDPHRAADCRAAIERVLAQDLTTLGAYNREKIKSFSLETVNRLMLDLYGIQ